MITITEYPIAESDFSKPLTLKISLFAAANGFCDVITSVVAIARTDMNFGIELYSRCEDTGISAFSFLAHIDVPKVGSIGKKQRHDLRVPIYGNGEDKLVYIRLVGKPQDLLLKIAVDRADRT